MVMLWLNGYKIYQVSIKYLFEMAIKYINIFLSETLKIFPKMGFLVGKQTIWQPCSKCRLTLERNLFM
jgi:hypothetical protein